MGFVSVMYNHFSTAHTHCLTQRQHPYVISAFFAAMLAYNLGGCCKLATWQACFAGINALITCGHGFGWVSGWSNGCGLVGCGWYHTTYSYHIPSRDIIYAACFSAYLVLNAPDKTTCHLYSTMWYRNHCFIPMFLCTCSHSNLHSHSQQPPNIKNTTA